MDWKKFKNTILEILPIMFLFVIPFCFVYFLFVLLGDNTKIVLKLENINGILKESIILLVLLYVVYWLIVLLWRFCSNCIIKLKYSIKKIDRDKNLKTNRLKEHKSTVCIINEKRKMYYPIDKYTLNKLGISTENYVIKKEEKDESKFFSSSSEGYTRGKEIKIYNIINDIKEKIELAKGLKDLSE